METCDCQSRIPKEERLMEVIKSNYPKSTFKKASFKEVAFMFGKSNLSTRMFNTIEVEFEDRKKPGKVEIVHSYCPFCGVKLASLDGEEKEPEVKKEEG